MDRSSETRLPEQLAHFATNCRSGGARARPTGSSTGSSRDRSARSTAARRSPARAPSVRGRTAAARWLPSGIARGTGRSGRWGSAATRSARPPPPPRSPSRRRRRLPRAATALCAVGRRVAGSPRAAWRRSRRARARDAPRTREPRRATSDRSEELSSERWLWKNWIVPVSRWSAASLRSSRRSSVSARCRTWWVFVVPVSGSPASLPQWPA